MASGLVRTAKSANCWTNYDLKAFNISIVPTGLTAFFGVQQLPRSPFDNNVVLNTFHADKMNGLSKDEAGFFTYLTSVELKGVGTVEPTVVDLAAFLLYFFFSDSSKDLVILQYRMLHFQMSGKRVDAIVDVALVDRDMRYFLLVQKDYVGIFHLFYTDV